MLVVGGDDNKNLASGWLPHERLHGAMATRRIPDPKIGGSIPSVFTFFTDQQNPGKVKNIGGPGYRSLCLVDANHALYHLS